MNFTLKLSVDSLYNLIQSLFTCFENLSCVLINYTWMENNLFKIYSILVWFTLIFYCDIGTVIF